MADAIRLASKHAAAIAFAVLISLPLAFLGYPELLGSSLSENRSPSVFPRTWSAKYLERIGDFFNDNLGFRNGLLHLGSRVMVWLGVTSSHPSVVVGDAGWLFFTDDSTDTGRATMKDFRGRSALPQDRVARIRGNLDTLARELGRCRVGFALWLVPNKESIYGEHLTGFREAAGKKRIDQLTAALSGAEGVLLVDGRPPLLAAKERSSGLDLYFRTDTHWNDLGAFVSYTALLGRLASAHRLPKREHAEEERYDVEPSPFAGGDLSANMLNAQWRFADTKVELVPRFKRSAVQAPREDLADFLYAWTNPAAGGSVVIYGDSFVPRAVPFIRERFGRGYVFAGNVVDGRVVGKLKPDLVILQIVERHVEWLASPAKDLGEICGASPRGLPKK